MFKVNVLIFNYVNLWKFMAKIQDFDAINALKLKLDSCSVVEISCLKI